MLCESGVAAWRAQAQAQALERGTRRDIMAVVEWRGLERRVCHQRVLGEPGRSGCLTRLCMAAVLPLVNSSRASGT